MKTTGETYTCRAGETFDSIALHLFGDETYSAALLCVNPLLSRTPLFTGGEVLQLPDIELPETETINVYMPATAPWKE